MSISLAMLAYNEEQNIEACVREVWEFFRDLRVEYEIIVVDDGSSDQTPKIAERLSKELSNVRVVHHETNLGLGGGYRTGFSESQKKFLTFWPADGQFDPRIIGDFYSIVDDYDLVLGYLPNRKRGFVGRTLSICEKVLYRLLFGPMPKFQGVFMTRRKLYDEIQLDSKGRGWAIVLEFIIKVVRGNYRVTSVPTDLRPRIGGESKVNNLRTIWSNVSQVISLRKYIRHE